MIDSFVRANLLQFLYARRDDGALAFGWLKGAIEPPAGIDSGDWFGAVAQLAEYNLIDWTPVFDESGRGLLGGHAHISEEGIEVVEKKRPSPIEISFDEARRKTREGRKGSEL